MSTSLASYQREEMLKNLGTEYTGATMLYKPWPAVGISHTYIHATIELMKEHRLKPADIEEIRVWIGSFQQRMCHPLEERRAPATTGGREVQPAVLRRNSGQSRPSWYFRFQRQTG